MDKNLHDIDDFFRAGLEGNEASPSASVKESLLAILDKRDAEIYRKKSSRWKRAALLMLFLLAGFIIYESSIFKIDNRDPGQRELSKSTVAGDPVGDKNEDDATPGQSNQDKKDEVIQKRNTPTFESGHVGKEKIDPFAEVGDKILKGNKFIPAKPGTNETVAERQNNFIAKTRPPVLQTKENSLPATNAENSIPDYEGETIGSNTVLSNKSESRIVAGLPQTLFPVASLSDKKFKMSGYMDSIVNSDLIKTSFTKIHHFKPYWTITGLAAYDRVNYKLDSDMPSNITSIGHREVHEPSYSAGLLATRQIKQRWGLQTGFIYSNNAIGISSQKIYALQDPAGDIAYKYITSSGYAYIKPGFGPPPAFGDSINSTEAKHTLHSVGIPLIVKHTIGKNKLLLIPGIGIEANFITRAKLTTEIEDASNRETVFINKLNGAKSFYWSFTADAELKYLVNKKIAFSLRPVFRYALTAITDNNVVETFPYSMGAGLGLTYQF